MERRPLLSLAVVLVSSLGVRPAAAQLAPTGAHYAAQASDTGFSGSVNSSGGYSASVPLDLPAARGGLPVPVSIVYGGRGVGAAGLGWDVPLSYIYRDRTIAHRRPMATVNGAWQAREAITLVLEGRQLDLVQTASGWAARRDAPGILVRQQDDGTWVMFDGQGRTYSFTVSPAMNGGTLWLLSSVTGVGGSKVQIDYSITTPSVPGGTGLAIDLIRASYNPSPTTAGCFKNSVALVYDADAATPVSLSVLGDRVVVRKHKLVTVNVNSKATCSDAYVRLRAYQLEYGQDADTRVPRLASVKLLGREGTAEAASSIPLGTYSYGSVMFGGTLQYQRATLLPVLDIGSKQPFTMRDNPGSSYVTVGSLLDITGDGVPEVVRFRRDQPPTLVGLRDWVNSSDEFALSDSVLAPGPIDARALQGVRYQGTGNVDQVWRQTIDVNGDGRIDIIDASEQQGRWVVYLNVPKATDARFARWEKRSYSTQKIAEILQARGFAIDPNKVPLSRRITGRSHIVRHCLMWDVGAFAWVERPRGFQTGQCIGPPEEIGPEFTFTEWEVSDLNGDGYPDVAFNSLPVEITTQEEGFPEPPFDPNEIQYTVISSVTQTQLPDSTRIEAVFNLLGVHVGIGSQPYGNAVLLRNGEFCGVAAWAATDSSHQEQICGLADVNGDGIVDRVLRESVHLGTGTFSSSGYFTPGAILTLPGRLASQLNNQLGSCAPPANGNNTFVTTQTAGLRDLTGDGIPDYITSTSNGGIVRIGTGTGFLDPLPIVSQFFTLSSQQENCGGTMSTTIAGLFDVDGDGKVDVLTPDGHVYMLFDSTALGAPSAGRLVQIDNGFGATTSIFYRSAKLLAPSSALNDLHQVPFPEVVVNAVQTTSAQGSTLAARTVYAYSGAQMVFDPTQDAFRFPGYRRHIALRIPDEQAPGRPPEGVAIITDIYEPSDMANPYDLPGSLTEAQRYARALRIGRVSDVTVLSGNVGTDPSLLVLVNAATDARRIASTHYEWDARLLTVAADPAGPEPCSEMVYPYDYPASVAFASVDACRRRGFAFATSVDLLRSEPGAAASSGAAVVTRTETRTIDNFGRVTSMKRLGDTTRTDDDVCVDTSFAAPTGSNERVLSARSAQTVTNCGTTTLAQETWVYDELALGQVSRGLATAHIVERRSEAGALLATVSRFDAQYTTEGNPVVIRTIREDGASRSTSIRYDAFALAGIIFRTTATGLPEQRIDLGRDPLTLNVTTARDANLTLSSTRFDGFDRPVMSTVTPPGGVEGALSCTTYQGFDGRDPQGRRVTAKVFTDALPPATACAATGHTATVFLDQLGRERITDVVLGADYPGITMKVGDRTYDSLGRISFEADPYPSNQNAATAYGTTRFFNTDGTPSCSIRGKGRQQWPSAFPVATNEASEIYPTCFTRRFGSGVETFTVRDAASLLAGSPQAGVVRMSWVTALGRVLGRSTFQGGFQDSNRIEHADFTHDRLGRLTGMTRYQNAAASTNPVTTRWHFDSLGQVLQFDEPDSPPQFNVYSNWGEVIETNRTVSGSLKRVVKRYDAHSRLTHSEQQTGGVVDPETVHDYFYDTPVQVAPQVTAANTLGRLAQATWPTGSVTFSYDGLGRTNAQVFSDAQAGNPQGSLYIEKHTLHGDGSLAALDLFLPDTAFANEHVDYTYDSAGRGRSVTYTHGTTKTLYQASTIDPFGRVRQAQRGAATYAATYADVGRRLMSQVTVSSPLGSRSISFAGFDPVGRERGRTETKSNTSGSATTNWTYDALGRLSTAVATRGSTPIFNQQFTYDPLGNLLSINNIGGGATNTTLTYSTTDRDRICRITFGASNGTTCNVTYDELGGILSQPTPTGSRQYTYLVDGAVRAIADDRGNSAHYRYDAFGQVQELDLDSDTSLNIRRDRHFGSLFTRHYERIGLSTPTPVLLRKIPGPDGLLATRHGPGGPWTFAYGEQRGSRFFTLEAREEEGTARNGEFVQDIDYEPFGKPAPTGAQPGSQLYSSNQWNSGDSLTAFGISQLGARLYDPAIGRFTSRDPLLIPRTATTTNPFAFASNDPVNSSDPTGLVEADTTSRCGGADNPCPIKAGDGGKPTTPSTPQGGAPDAISGGSLDMGTGLNISFSVYYLDYNLDPGPPSTPEGSLVTQSGINDLMSSSGGGGGIGATLFGQVYMDPMTYGPRGGAASTGGMGSGGTGSYPVCPECIKGPSIPDRIIEAITDILADRAIGVFRAVGAPYPEYAVAQTRPLIKGTVTIAVQLGFDALLGTLVSRAIMAVRLAPRLLSNAEVRAWYSPRAKAVDTSGPLTRRTAERVHGARNGLKAEARGMMADRAAAAELDLTQPLRPIEYYIEKYTAQGYSGEALWERIIKGGTTPNSAVDAAFGVQ
jgi:RHS repeat-associated protein